ncbi:hypothetical protein L1887_32297 [Cichorium endivia]|nr:hypothetical protein L1887_32297 [Cichorium endivia]
MAEALCTCINNDLPFYAFVLVWSSDSDDDEVRKPSHSAFMVYDVGKSFLKDTSEKVDDEEMLEVEATAGLGFVTSEAHEMMAVGTPNMWFDDSSDDDEEICLMANDTRLTIPEQVSKLLSTFKIPTSQSAPIINEITRDCSVKHKLLIDAKNREVLTEQKLLSFRGRVESLKLALEKSNLRICLLEENREKILNNHDVILKQRNIFCETAKRLYAHITSIYHSVDVCNVQHRQLLPFIEFKLKEVDSISYECESIISSSAVTNPSYKHGLISVEKHLTADNLLKRLPQEIPILKKVVPLFETKEKVIVDNISEKGSESDSDMEEVDCSSLTLLKSSSISESPSEDISQLSLVDKGKTKVGCGKTHSSEDGCIGIDGIFSISKKSTNEKFKRNWKRGDLKENLTAKSKSSMNSKSSSKKKTPTSTKSTSSKQKWVPKTCILSVTSDSSHLTKNSSEICSDSPESCSSHEASENLINLNANEISEEAIERWIQESFAYPEDSRLIGYQLLLD